MRDERGRYISTAIIDELGPEWAKGCERCEYGITNAPDLTGAVSVSMERMVQAIESNGRIFCTCRAGVAARSNLKNRKQRLIEEAKTMPLAREHGYNSAPDIEIAKQLIDKARAKSVPTMHYEGARVPA
jgi:hypothetical protein